MPLDNLILARAALPVVDAVSELSNLLVMVMLLLVMLLEKCACNAAAVSYTRHNIVTRQSIVPCII